MAGRPLTRARAAAAEAEAVEVKQNTDEKLRKIHLALVRRGIDPREIDEEASAAAPVLTAYSADLPLAITRLSGSGMSLEEIRDSLGFTDGQEREWADQYVDFAAAVSRTRTREEAFWNRQMRQAASAGDRTTVSSIQSLISKKYLDKAGQGDASQLIVVHIGKPLDKRTDGEG